MPDLTEKEKSLIEKLRKIKFGQVTVYILNGQPDRIVKTEESVKL